VGQGLAKAFQTIPRLLAGRATAGRYSPFGAGLLQEPGVAQGRGDGIGIGALMTDDIEVIGYPVGTFGKGHD